MGSQTSTPAPALPTTSVPVVGVRRGERVALGRAERADRGAGRDVPDPHGAVRRGAGQPPAAGVEADRGDPVGVPRQHADPGPVARAVHVDVVAGGHREQRAVRAERHPVGRGLRNAASSAKPRGVPDDHPGGAAAHREAARRPARSRRRPALPGSVNSRRAVRHAPQRRPSWCAGRPRPAAGRRSSSTPSGTSPARRPAGRAPGGSGTSHSRRVPSRPPVAATLPSSLTAIALTAPSAPASTEPRYGSVGGDEQRAAGLDRRRGPPGAEGEQARPAAGRRPGHRRDSAASCRDRLCCPRAWTARSPQRASPRPPRRPRRAAARSARRPGAQPAGATPAATCARLLGGVRAVQELLLDRLQPDPVRRRLQPLGDRDPAAPRGNRSSSCRPVRSHARAAVGEPRCCSDPRAVRLHPVPQPGPRGEQRLVAELGALLVDGHQPCSRSARPAPGAAAPRPARCGSTRRRADDAVVEHHHQPQQHGPGDLAPASSSAA